MRKLSIFIIIFCVAYPWTNAANATSLKNAYTNHQSDVQVKGNGIVIRILSDDNHGSKHQKFILKLSSGHTILIAHNIDLAPRINAISVGDIIGFNGKYEWNKNGGVVHWTHQDPNRRHVGGWSMHNGTVYQ